MFPNLTIPIASRQTQTQKQTASSSKSNAGSDGLNGVYWVGSNGRIYFKDNSGKVKDMGVGKAGGDTGFDAALGSAQARRIADPNAPAAATQNASAAAAPAYGGGSGGGVSYPDLSGAINILRQNIASLDPIYQASVKNAIQSYDTANNERAAAFDKTKSTSDASAVSNDQNVLLSRNAIGKSSRMSAESISSLLNSMGMGGSVTNKALSTIADKNNTDLNTANYGYGKNKQSILQSWNDYVNADANQQKQLVDQREYSVAQAGIQRETAKKDSLNQIASNKIQMGQGTGDILNEIAGANSSIANLSNVKNTYDGKVATYTAPSIGSILGPTQAALSVVPGSGAPGVAPKIVKVNEQNGTSEKYGLVA